MTKRSKGELDTAESVTIALTGSGGAGVMTAGSLLLKAAADAGWYGLMTRSSGPQIRGGEAAALLTLSSGPMAIHKDRFDILLAVDWLNTDRFAAEIPLGPGSLVLGDPESGEPPEFITRAQANRVDVSLKEMAGSVPGGRINMVALGLVAGLVGLPEDNLHRATERTLAGKGPEAVESGLACLGTGLKAASGLESPVRLERHERRKSPRWMISGNEAAGLGAVRGGVRFAAAYPITPATEILEWLAPALTKAGGTLVQAEDELASINMIIGASYGGTPALTATSGPGLALMTESLGLATAAEVPVVVIDVMRGGPSTGIPTKSEQSDLNLAVYGLHGDAPHVVVAPVSIADCLFTTQWAVHLAEAMQVPAIVLSDQSLGQARAVIDRPADLAFVARREIAADPQEGYRRYAITANGVSPMAIPGTAGGQYTADGLEHDPHGAPSSRAEDHSAQLDKRRDKIAGFDYGGHWADLDGAGDLAVITWGSATGAAREGLARAARDGVDARLIALRLLSPARPDPMAAALTGVKRLLVVEQSHDGQFHKYLRAHYDLPDQVRAFHRPGPLPINAAEIHQQIRDWR